MSYLRKAEEFLPVGSHFPLIPVVMVGNHDVQLMARPRPTWLHAFPMLLWWP